jgi:hypothetical protein
VRREKVRRESRKKQRIDKRPHTVLSIEGKTVKYDCDALLLLDLGFKSIRSIQLEADAKGPCKLTLVLLTKEDRRENLQFDLNGSDDARIARRIAMILGMEHNIEGNHAVYAEPHGGFNVNESKIWKLTKITHNSKTAHTRFEYSGGKTRRLKISTVLLQLLLWIYVRRTHRKVALSKVNLESTMLTCDVLFYS